MNDRARIQRKRTHDTVLEQSRGRIAVDGVARSRGQSMDGPDRAFFETRLGHDFSRVRVHADAEAAESAAALHARAYTIGSDVVFGDGNYAPADGYGRQLLAHELTHVVQQGADVETGAASSAEALTFGEPGDQFESAADLAADSVVFGEAPTMAAYDGGSFGQAAPGAQLQYEDEQSEWSELPYDGQSIDYSLPMDGQSIDYSLPDYSGGGGYDGAEGSGGGPSSSPGEGFGTKDLYNLATNNVLGAGISLAENTNALSTAASLGGQSPLGAALAPLGVYSGVQSVNEAWDRPLAENDYLGSGLQKGGDLVANSAGLASSVIGTTGLMGAGLTAAGATGTGGLLTSTAASLGPAGAVLAAGAGGYAAGNWLAENTALGDASVGLVGGIDSLLTGEGERSALLRASEWLEDTF